MTLKTNETRQRVGESKHRHYSDRMGVGRAGEGEGGRGKVLTWVRVDRGATW